MSGYCTADDVCKAFPTFARNATGSIQDADITAWIELRKARIRSALLTRGFDPDDPGVSGDALNLLKSVNLDGAVADLGDSLQGTATLQPGEYNLPGARRKSYEAVLKEIMTGEHDQLFQPTISRTENVTPLFSGVGGAETEVSTPRERGENRKFGINQRF